MYGIFGVATTLVGFLMLSLSIRASPWFDWTRHALSDLGAGGFGSVLFNSGLMITGGLMMLFSLGLVELTTDSGVGRLGAYIHLTASWLLVGIGIANINVKPWHWYFSVGFFISISLSLLVFTVYFMKNGLTPHALISGLASLTSACVWALDWPSLAMPECIAVGASGIWQILIGLWMMLWVFRGRPVSCP
ncbi:MAG: DUF998 domain-containing protein [Candidatus Bathyarchaeia archaeon]